MKGGATYPFNLLSKKKDTEKVKKAVAELTENGNACTVFKSEKHDLMNYHYEIVCLLDDFKKHRVFMVNKFQSLGSGGIGTLYAAQELFENTKPHITNMCVVKIPNSMQYETQISNEHERLSKLGRSRGLLKTKGAMYSFSEYVPERDLIDLCYSKPSGVYTKTHLEIPLLVKIAKAILSKVHKLHQKHSMLHRDLKMSNIRVHIIENEVKIHLIDFDSACDLSKSNNKFTGSIGYQAPEMQDDDAPEYAKNHDFFSVGVIWAELFSKTIYQDFISEWMNECKKNNQTKKFTLAEYKKAFSDIFQSENAAIPLTIINNIKLLMDPDFKKRPGLHKIEEILKSLTALEKTYTSPSKATSSMASPLKLNLPTTPLPSTSPQPSPRHPAPLIHAERFYIHNTNSSNSSHTTTSSIYSNEDDDLPSSSTSAPQLRPNLSYLFTKNSDENETTTSELEKQLQSLSLNLTSNQPETKTLSKNSAPAYTPSLERRTQVHNKNQPVQPSEPKSASNPTRNRSASHYNDTHAPRRQLLKNRRLSMPEPYSEENGGNNDEFHVTTRSTDINPQRDIIRANSEDNQPGSHSGNIRHRSDSEEKNPRHANSEDNQHSSHSEDSSEHNKLKQRKKRFSQNKS